MLRKPRVPEQEQERAKACRLGQSEKLIKQA